MAVWVHGNGWEGSKWADVGGREAGGCGGGGAVRGCVFWEMINRKESVASLQNHQ